MALKVAFLDRDGVINQDAGYVYKVEDFQYTENAVAALKIIRNLGYQLLIVTNQAGIGRGLYSEAQHETLKQYLIEDLKENDIELLDYFHCPHHPTAGIGRYKKDCPCRKPAPGMILRGLKKYNVDLKSSFIVGDKTSDIQAGIRAGLSRCFLINAQFRSRHSELDGFECFESLFNFSNYLRAHDEEMASQ